MVVRFFFHIESSLFNPYFHNVMKKKNSDGNQFHQYHKKRTTIYHLHSLSIEETTACGVGNLVPCLDQI